MPRKTTKKVNNVVNNNVVDVPTPIGNIRIVFVEDNKADNPPKPVDEHKLNKLRDRFAELREVGCYNAGRKLWHAEFNKLLAGYGDKPTPEQYVEAAEKVTTPCDRCTNGIYYWGTCNNGKMQYSAQCFRCGGKGKQNVNDYFRNRAYDNHKLRVV